MADEDESAADPAWRRHSLAFGSWVASVGRIRRRMAGKAPGAMKRRVPEITRRNGGGSLPTVTLRS